MPESDPKPFPSFREFKDSVLLEDTPPFRPLVLSEPDDKLVEMRRHLARIYRGVEAEQSFIDENGQIFDCVPM